MGKFNFEDYRQPWETGPHWELKKEFIEAYQDTFEEDRLLCLAQAYSNIILMNCSYPGPVMRQISELSKPLKMRKKFQGISSSDETESFNNNKPKGKNKKKSEKAGGPFKQIKFCASEDQCKSTSPPDSTNVHQSSLEQFKSSCPLSESSQLSSESFSQICAIPSFNVTKQPQSFLHNESDHNEGGIFLENEEDERIISVLGLPFIKRFVETINIMLRETQNMTDAVFRVFNKLGIRDECSFTLRTDHYSPENTKLFISKVFIKNCEIASKTAQRKKEAKLLSAKAAVDTLVKLSTYKSAEIKPQKNSIIQPKPSTHKILDCMEVLQLFSKSIVNRNRIENEPAIFTLKTIASLLDMSDCIAFDVTSYKISPTQTEYCCKFFLKSILISNGKANVRDDAEKIAADLGLEKLSNLSEYEIHNQELEKKHSSFQASYSDTSRLSHSCIETRFEKPRFILNKTMYDLSLRDAFVVIEREKYKADIQTYSRTILSESACFNRKKFEYQFEDDFATMPPTKRAVVLIGGVAVGSGAALLKGEAKNVACARALNDLKKKYYTLRIKGEYVEGFVVTRNQVIDGASFSSNVISESNVGCKMLKKMGWTGGGLGENGIAEPIQTDAKLSLGRGLGFGASKDSQNLLFRKRLEAMLLNFCKSENFSDLIFSKDFTKEERKQIHQVASRMNLHTQSHGVKMDRFLAVRQKYEPAKLLKFLVDNGGSNSKFELIDDSDFSLQV